jgi:ribose transport system permease protein
MKSASIEKASSDMPDSPPNPIAKKRGLGRSLLSDLGPRNIGAVYILIVICVIFTIWVPSSFPQWATVKQVIDENAITAMGALAIIVPLATRTFDLSFAYTMSLSGVTAAHFIVQEHTDVPLAMLIGILVALLIGLINGFVVVVMRIDSFIGTLATGSLVEAFIEYFTNDVSITNPKLAAGFSKLGQDSVGGVILPVLYALGIALALWVLLEHTPTGRRLYAVGFNADAARLANINVNRLRFCSLLTSSLIAGFAGICLASTLGSGDPTSGDSYLLPGFAAAFVGATQFKNGRFNSWGTIVAVLMLGTGTVGLGLATSAPWADDMFTGVVLIGALAATGFRRQAIRAGKRGLLRWRT